MGTLLLKSNIHVNLRMLLESFSIRFAILRWGRLVSKYILGDVGNAVTESKYTTWSYIGFGSSYESARKAYRKPNLV